jgi:hypothetical protein
MPDVPEVERVEVVEVVDVEVVDAGDGTDGPSGEAPGTTASRSLAVPASLGALLVWILFVLLISYGSGDLFHRETFGGFYDAQAEALLDGDLAVDPDAVRFEGFRMDDGTFVYQGLLPAVLRVPVLAATDSFDGRLTGLSMVIAFAIALVAAVRVTLCTRRLVRGSAPVGRAEEVRAGFLVFGLGGSTLLFLAAKAWIYHEALLWGAALSLLSLSFLLDWLADDRHRTSRLVLAGIAACAAIHSRFSTGAGAVAALALVAAALVVAAVLRRRGDDRGWSAATGLSAAGPVGPFRAPIAVLVLSVVVATASYAAVNQARFGTSFSIPIDRQVLVGFDEQFQEALADNSGSLFGLRYTPTQVWQLVRPDALSFGTTFPFVTFPADPPSALGGAVFAERDWSSSLPLSEPLLVLGALAGLAATVLPRRLSGRNGPAAVRLPVLGSLVAVGGFGVIGYVAFRYQADLWPTLVLLAPLGVHLAGERLDGTRVARRLLTAAVAALALWGGWVNASLALEYQRVIAPGAWVGARADWLRTQERFGVVVTPLELGEDEPLPPAGPRSQVLVVGDCEALYRSNGDLWYLVEGGQATGSYRGVLDVGNVPTGTGILLRGSGPDGATELALEGRPDGAVRFLVVSMPGDGSDGVEATGPWFRIDPGDRLAVRTEVDWRTGFAEVRDGEDRELLSASLDLSPVPSLEPVDSGDVRLNVLTPTRPVCRSLGGDD